MGEVSSATWFALAILIVINYIKTIAVTEESECELFDKKECIDFYFSYPFFCGLFLLICIFCLFLYSSHYYHIFINEGLIKVFGLEIKIETQVWWKLYRDNIYEYINPRYVSPAHQLYLDGLVKLQELTVELKGSVNEGHSVIRRLVINAALAEESNPVLNTPLLQIQHSGHHDNHHSSDLNHNHHNSDPSSGKDDGKGQEEEDEEGGGSVIRGASLAAHLEKLEHEENLRYYICHVYNNNVYADAYIASTLILYRMVYMRILYSTVYTQTAIVHIYNLL